MKMSGYSLNNDSFMWVYDNIMAGQIWKKKKIIWMVFVIK